jgi:hypothetical protein
MGEKENNLINIEELANKIAQDFTEFAKTASTIELPKDLKTLDFASILPSATANLVKAVGSRIQTDSAKVQQEHEAQIEKRDQLLEESIAERQQHIKVILKEIKDDEGDDVTKIIKTNLEKDVKKFDRHIEELKFATTMKVGQIKGVTVISDAVKISKTEK